MAQRTVSSKHQLVIPKEVRERAGIKPGQKLNLIATASGVQLVRVPTLEEWRGIAGGANTSGLHEKRDRVWHRVPTISRKPVPAFHHKHAGVATAKSTPSTPPTALGGERVERGIPYGHWGPHGLGNPDPLPSPSIPPPLRDAEAKQVRQFVAGTIEATRSVLPHTTLCVWSLDRDTPVGNVAAVCEAVRQWSSWEARHVH